MWDVSVTHSPSPAALPKPGLNSGAKRPRIRSFSLLKELSERFPRSPRPWARNAHIAVPSDPSAAPRGHRGDPGLLPTPAAAAVSFSFLRGSSASLKVPGIAAGSRAHPAPAAAFLSGSSSGEQKGPSPPREAPKAADAAGKVREGAEERKGEQGRIHKGWTGATAPLLGGPSAGAAAPGGQGRTKSAAPAAPASADGHKSSATARWSRIPKAHVCGRGDGHFPQVLGQCPLICIHLHAVKQCLTDSLRRSGLSPNLSGTFSLPVKVGLGCN